MSRHYRSLIRCQRCDVELPPEFGSIPRLPCPECGSTGRQVSMAVGGGTSKLTGGNVSLIHTRPGLDSEARRDDQGNISLTATGRSPKNEEDVLEVCSRLVRQLNTSGETWSVPIAGMQDVDAISVNSAGDCLQMQVTRASTNREFWETLNRIGSTSRRYFDTTVANEIMEAIRRKSKSKYPLEQRKKLVLVLDAARTPSHTFQPVLVAFRDRYFRECQEAGFAQVWLVGPQDSLVERIDV